MGCPENETSPSSCRSYGETSRRWRRSLRHRAADAVTGTSRRWRFGRDFYNPTWRSAFQILPSARVVRPASRGPTRPSCSRCRCRGRPRTTGRRRPARTDGVGVDGSFIFSETRVARVASLTRVAVGLCRVRPRRLGHKCAAERRRAEQQNGAHRYLVASSLRLCDLDVFGSRVRVAWYIIYAVGPQNWGALRA